MRQTTGVGGGESAQREIAGANVGVQLVFSAAVLLEGAKQAAVGFAERRGLDAAGHDGGINMAVVSRVADRDGQVAEVEFDVLVAGDSLDGEVSGRHADKEHGRTGDFDSDFQIVLWTAKDAQVRVIVPVLEAHCEFAGVVSIAPIQVDGNLVVVVTHDPELPGTKVKA